VAVDDPNYLRWIADEVEDCDEQDREAANVALAYRGRLSRGAP
jgi:hypothetical protein